MAHGSVARLIFHRQKLLFQASSVLLRGINISFTNLITGARTYLSEAYKCNDVWEKRLEAPIIKQINLEDMFHEIDQKFQRERIISPVDVDLFATAVHGDSHLDELEDLVLKLRLSANACKMLPSTPHSLIRTFLHAGNTDALLRVLNDRLNYGVFPDNYATNLLLDTFIENKQYLGKQRLLAAKVGMLQMLQENWEQPLTTFLSILGCVQHIKNPKSWDSVGMPPPLPVDESKEEVKVRVKYLRNPHFDDHFDLQEGNHLVGKTLAVLAPHIPNKTLAQSIELLGWVLYGKWNKACEVSNRGIPIIDEAVKIATESLKASNADENIPEDKQKLQDQLASASTCEGDLVSSIETHVKDAVKEFESVEIENQKVKYEAWEKLREQKLIEQLTELDRTERLRVVEEKKKYLEEKEEEIYFFDKQNEWELRIEENRPKYRKRWFGKKKPKRVLDEAYVPPEIGRGAKNK